MVEITKPYQTRRVQFEPKGESMTEQHHKDSVNINNIVERFQRTGVVEHRNEHRGEYGFADAITFQEAMYTVTKGQQIFDELPSHIRKKFNHDPAEFLGFVQNPENAEEMVKLGLATTIDDIPSKIVQKDKADLNHQVKPPNPEGGRKKGETTE